MRVLYFTVALAYTLMFTALPVNASAIHAGWNDVSEVIADVSIKSGVDATFLAAVGAIESGFRPTVRAKGKVTTATGLYQFTNRTWEVTLDSYGHLYGLDESATRTDAFANTAMGAEYIKENQRVIEKRLRRKATDVELYMAHLISPQRVVHLSRKSSKTNVAKLYPTLAKLNPNLFFKQGRGVTKAEFYSLLANKIKREKARYQTLATTAVAELKYKESRRQWNEVMGDYNPYDCSIFEMVRATRGDISKIKDAIDSYPMETALLSDVRATPTAVNDWPSNSHAVYSMELFYDRRRLA